MSEAGKCMECGASIGKDAIGYCKPCIEKLSGRKVPATIGCAECLGTGRIDGRKCPDCGGTGQVPW